jgi:hypothetical protein
MTSLCIAVLHSSIHIVRTFVGSINKAWSMKDWKWVIPPRVGFCSSCILHGKSALLAYIATKRHSSDWRLLLQFASV